ncbi:unnamed protein product [Peniophora sp. CBMAI 1063]|nr:unnamed protein product [Peniophora sp. CBMAI 1063]
MSLILTTDWPAPEASEELSGVYRHPFHDRSDYTEDECEDQPVSANERNMCALSAVLRSKPQWWTKYTDPDIRARWKSEAVGAPVPYGKIPLKEEEVEYVLDELTHYAAMRDPVTGIEASVAARIWQSDSLVDEDLRNELLDCVTKLEGVPDELKDWHPRANGQVLDLVHPSLYPGVYGHTAVQPYSLLQGTRDVPRPQYTIDPATIVVPDSYGSHRLSSEFPAMISASFISPRFQWLPTDFVISEDGASAHVLGYINNLEPRVHASSYPVLERLVARFVPLWERVLGETAAGYLPPMRTEGGYKKDHLREWTEEELETGEEPPFVITLPSVEGPFTAHPPPPTVDLRGKTLQVIVKLANIHLTPDAPEYPGGSWHVEGMINEAIVSTGIYYYDEDNVTESRLAYRASVNAPSVGQHDVSGARATYGLARDDPLMQTLGAVVTKAGRSIAFPNIYQHQVQPFALADTSRPGHRKILALFLVDPSLEHPRPSTTFVPPQQREWMYTTIRSLSTSSDSRLSRLPLELLDAIVENIDGLMDRAEAEELRLELMDERTKMTDNNLEEMFEVPFNISLISFAAGIYIDIKANKAKPDFITERRLARRAQTYESRVALPSRPNTPFQGTWSSSPTLSVEPCQSSQYSYASFDTA